MKRATLFLPGVLVGALLAGLPSVGQATDARVEALTINGLYIDDFEELQLFPTVIARSGNRVVAGLGSNGGSIQDNTFGVIAGGKESGYGTFALFLRGTSPFLSTIQGMDPEVAPNIGVPEQQYDIGWARQFGRMALGARIEHARSSTKAGDDTESPFQNAGANWNTTAFHAGVKFDMGATDFLELGGEFRSNSYKNEATEVEDDAGMSFRLSGRYWKTLNDRTQFVPAFNFQNIDLTRMGEDDPQHTYSNIHAGGAFLFDVNQDNLLTLGVAMNRQKDNFNDVAVTWLPTLFGSLEWDAKSWLTARVGCQQAMRNEKSGDNLDVKTSDFLYGLGVGLHFNNFDIDCTLNQNFPFTGGYFISGDETPGTMFGRVTADYHF